MAGVHAGLVPGRPDDRTRPVVRRSAMKKLLGMVGALLLAFVVGRACAEEIQGKIKSLDTAERVIALENGTKIWVAEGLSMDRLREGALVKASYEEREGKKIATSLEVK
jgi:hypothetical protein